MRRHGTLKKWNDERGFGFIEPNEGPPEVFVHIKGYARRSTRPQVNERVTYFLETLADGKTRATDVRLLGHAEPEQTVEMGDPRRLLAIPVLLGIVLSIAAKQGVAGAVGAGYLVLSLVTLLAYASDKSAAKKGDWRVPEVNLHVLSLLGGWPGALVGQVICRHKTSKADFQKVFWFTVAAHVVVLLVVLYNLDGIEVLRRLRDRY